jgi:hypothetical protein
LTPKPGHSPMCESLFLGTILENPGHLEHIVLNMVSMAAYAAPR